MNRTTPSDTSMARQPDLRSLATSAPPLLVVERLEVRLPIRGELKRVLHDVNLTIRAGETLGLVGESGSGKSMTARAIDRLLPPGATVKGAISYAGQEVASLDTHGLRRYRAEVGMIFQDPRVHINPVRRIGDFMAEAVVSSGQMSRRQAKIRSLELLDAVHIDRGPQRLRQYPHELSGGMLQRVMIATALLPQPRLILADVPTTALDVTTQAEVMTILDQLRRELGVAMLFITHDLALAAAVCDRTAVMYAGQIVECASSAHLDDDPLHPYTAALQRARPRIDSTARRLEAIAGQSVSAFDAPADQCAFAPRCRHASDRCCAESPEVTTIDGVEVRCLLAEELHRGHPASELGSVGS